MSSRSTKKQKFTKELIENATLPDKGQTFLWDTELSGFGLRLTPTARTYIVQGRINTQERRISIGRHGAITLQEARKLASKELLAMASGVDSVKARAIVKIRATTLREAFDAYIRDRQGLKPSSIADIKKHLNISFRDWKDKEITAITRDMAAVRFRERTEKSPAQANQAFRVLRAVMNYSMGCYRDGDKPIVSENPVRVLSDLKIWNSITPRSGRIPTKKIGDVWNLLQELRKTPDQTTVSRTMADLLSFLLLTGSRWSEAACLTWEQVNIDDAGWHLPDPKNREAKTFPLPAALVDLLKDRPHTGDFVFPSRNKGAGAIHDTRNLFKQISEKAGCHISAHDLRRTFRAICGECEIEFWKTKLLMGHRMSGDITIQHYTETSDLRYLDREINQIASWVQRQGLIASSGNVLKMPIAQ